MTATARNAIVVGLVAVALMGCDSNGAPSAAAVPVGSVLRALTASPSTAAATPTPTIAATPEATPEPTPEATVSPELAFKTWKSVFAKTSLPFFKTDVADAIESDFYWINSVDRVRYDQSRNLLTFDASIDFASVYHDDRREWRSDTWELFQSYGRDIWQPFIEAFGDLDGATPEWSRWTPSVKLDGNGGRLTAACTGSFIYAITQREATQSEFAHQCLFRS